MSGSDPALARRAWRAMSELALDRERKMTVAHALGLSWTRVLALRRLAGVAVGAVIGIAHETEEGGANVCLAFADVARVAFARGGFFDFDLVPQGS